MQTENKLYAQGLAVVNDLEKEYGAKAAVLHKAYEMAVQELGLSDKDLASKNASRAVATVMFSDEILGNKEVNPFLADGFDKLSAADQQRSYETTLGMNRDSFIGGVMGRYGTLKRGAVNAGVEEVLGSHISTGVKATLWKELYNPEASLDENMTTYVSALNAMEPILTGTGAKADRLKFESFADLEGALEKSLRGTQNRENLQYKHGVDFN